MKKRTLRPEERRIWAKVAATVTPRPGRFVAQTDETLHDESAQRKSRQSPQAKPKTTPPGLARFARQTSRQPVDDALERSDDKRIRRGRVDIDARLDLHGMTQVQARAALEAFLARLRERGGRCGLVITGKGRAPADEDAYAGRGEGVLRQALPGWLAAPGLRAMVAGYAPAHRRHGGEGAFYVFLKRR